MKIDFSAAEIDAPASLRAAVERRVLLALSRFAPEVRRVTVTLAAPPNPLGGIDHRCRIRAHLRTEGEVQAEAIGGDSETAVSRAAAQTVQRVEVALQRG